MCVDQHLCSRSFKRDPAFGADDGVAQVDAAADPTPCTDLFELFDEGDGVELRTIQRDGYALLEPDRMRLRRLWLREGFFRKYPCVLGDTTFRGQRLLATD